MPAINYELNSSFVIDKFEQIVRFLLIFFIQV